VSGTIKLYSLTEEEIRVVEGEGVVLSLGDPRHKGTD